MSGEGERCVVGLVARVSSREAAQNVLGVQRLVLPAMKSALERSCAVKKEDFAIYFAHLSLGRGDGVGGVAKHLQDKFEEVHDPVPVRLLPQCCYCEDEFGLVVAEGEGGGGESGEDLRFHAPLRAFFDSVRGSGCGVDCVGGTGWKVGGDVEEGERGGWCGEVALFRGSGVKWSTMVPSTPPSFPPTTTTICGLELWDRESGKCLFRLEFLDKHSRISPFPPPTRLRLHSCAPLRSPIQEALGWEVLLPREAELLLSFVDERKRSEMHPALARVLAARLQQLKSSVEFVRSVERKMESGETGKTGRDGSGSGSGSGGGEGGKGGGGDDDVPEGVERAISAMEKGGKGVLVVMRGVPGSGKSTLTRKIQRRMSRRGRHVDVRVASADTHFEKGPHGALYVFDFRSLHRAHQLCQETVQQAMMEEVPLVVLDNTSTRFREFSPYLAMAEKHGYEVAVVRFDCPNVATSVLLSARNAHGVPLDKVQEFAQRLRENPYAGEDVVIPGGIPPSVLALPDPKEDGGSEGGGEEVDGGGSVVLGEGGGWDVVREMLGEYKASSPPPASRLPPPSISSSFLAITLSTRARSTLTTTLFSHIPVPFPIPDHVTLAFAPSPSELHATPVGCVSAVRLVGIAQSPSVIAAAVEPLTLGEMMENLAVGGEDEILDDADLVSLANFGWAAHGAWRNGRGISTNSIPHITLWSAPKSRNFDSNNLLEHCILRKPLSESIAQPISYTPLPPSSQPVVFGTVSLHSRFSKSGGPTATKAEYKPILEQHPIGLESVEEATGHQLIHTPPSQPPLTPPPLPPTITSQPLPSSSLLPIFAGSLVAAAFEQSNHLWRSPRSIPIPKKVEQASRPALRAITRLVLLDHLPIPARPFNLSSFGRYCGVPATLTLSLSPHMQLLNPPDIISSPLPPKVDLDDALQNLAHHLPNLSQIILFSHEPKRPHRILHHAPVAGDGEESDAAEVQVDVKVLEVVEDATDGEVVGLLKRGGLDTDVSKEMSEAVVKWVEEVAGGCVGDVRVVLGGGAKYGRCICRRGAKVDVCVLPPREMSASTASRVFAKCLEEGEVKQVFLDSSNNNTVLFPACFLPNTPWIRVHCHFTTSPLLSPSPPPSLGPILDVIMHIFARACLAGEVGVGMMEEDVVRELGSTDGGAGEGSGEGGVGGMEKGLLLIEEYFAAKFDPSKLPTSALKQAGETLKTNLTTIPTLFLSMVPILPPSCKIVAVPLPRSIEHPEDSLFRLQFLSCRFLKLVLGEAALEAPPLRAPILSLLALGATRGVPHDSLITL